MKDLEVLLGSGFTLYESKILLSLHARGAATAKEIWQDTGMPKNKIYEMLELLKNQQIIQLLPTKPKRYSVINLKSALREKLRKQEKTLKELDANIDTALTVSALAKSYEQTFWVMEGKAAMLDDVLGSLNDIKEESIGFIDVWAARPANYKAVRDAIKRGVKFYFLGTVDEQSKPIARAYAKLGVQIRHYPVKAAGYSIFDKRKVQMRVTEGKIILLSVESPHFAAILRQHFFELWKNAKKVEL